MSDGGTRPKIVALPTACGEAGVVHVGQVEAGRWRAFEDEPELARQGRDGHGVVAGDDLQMHAGRGQALERLARVRPQLLTQGEERERAQAVGQLRLAVARAQVGRVRRRGKEHHAQPVVGPLVGLLRDLVGHVSPPTRGPTTSGAPSTYEMPIRRVR